MTRGFKTPRLLGGRFTVTDTVPGNVPGDIIAQRYRPVLWMLYGKLTQNTSGEVTRFHNLNNDLEEQ